MDGWIKLHRKCLENKIFLHDPTAWRVFEYLLLICNRKTGSYDTGRYWLGKALGIKPTTAYNSLLRLEKAQMIDIKSNNKFSTISILNWSTYQHDDNTCVDNKLTTRRQQDDTKQEVRKKKEETIYKEKFKNFKNIKNFEDIKVMLANKLGG